MFMHTYFHCMPEKARPNFIIHSINLKHDLLDILYTAEMQNKSTLDAEQTWEKCTH